MQLRWLYQRRNLGAWLKKWETRNSKLLQWVEDNIEQTLPFYSLPLAHHKHLKSTNKLEQAA